jgi:zinc protease
MLDRKIAPSSPPFHPFSLKKAQTNTLSNGIPVHTLCAGSQPIIRLEFVFKAGSWFENKNGLSHLASKMMTEGTSKMSSKQIADTIALYGAFVEVHQGFEHVNLTFYLMEKNLSNLLPVIVDILTDSIFPEKELENIKTITLQSLRVNKEKTQFVASNEFKKALFGLANPYGRHYEEEDIQSVVQKDILDFAHNSLQIGNMEVFVSGQFQLTKTIKLLDTYLGTKTGIAGASKHDTYSNQNPKPSKVLVEKEGAMQSSIRYGSHSVERKHPDFVGFLVVNELLGGFFGSRLMRNIREEKGYTYGIHSSVHPMMHASYFVVATDVKIENTLQTLQEIDFEINRLKTELVPQNELKTVQSYMLGRFMNSINTPFSLIDKFKVLHFNGLDYDYFDRYVNEVQNMNPDAILLLANKYLNTDQFYRVVVGGLQE